MVPPTNKPPPPPHPPPTPPPPPQSQPTIKPPSHPPISTYNTVQSHTPARPLPPRRWTTSCHTATASDIPGSLSGSFSGSPLAGSPHEREFHSLDSPTHSPEPSRPATWPPSLAINLPPPPPPPNPLPHRASQNLECALGVQYLTQLGADGVPTALVRVRHWHPGAIVFLKYAETEVIHDIQAAEWLGS